MANVFNADDNGIPFFGSEVVPNPRLSFSNVGSESHVPGRHLNALLTAESTLDIDVKQSTIEKHAGAAAFSYSGSIPFPLNRETPSGKPVNFNDHNLREGFHALYALARYRDSSWAAETAENSINQVFELWDPDSGWDRKKLKTQFGLNYLPGQTFITGIGRSIGPLVKLYRTTGQARALELAMLLASKATAEFFRHDGVYDRSKFGPHTHSTTCVMSSLAQLADLTEDSDLIERVRTFFDNGLWDIRDEIGWVIENSSEESPADRGECNNTGDIIETALILGRWGHPQYFQDAERMIRGHLLPAQLRDNTFIKDPENPLGEDGLKDIAARHLGAFGFPAPYGHWPLDVERVKFNMDIVGGAVASLCEVLREGVTTGADGHKVNLMFDCETPGVQVVTNQGYGGVTVIVKQPAPLWIRLPVWAKRSSVRITGAANHKISGAYILISEPPVGKSIKVTYPIPSSEITLNHRKRSIRTKLHGDTVVAMDNFGADLTFFDPIDG